MLEAAVDVAQRSLGLFDGGTRRTGRFELVLELHAEHAACGPVEPVHEPAAGFQRHRGAAPGRLEPASEVTIS